MNDISQSGAIIDLNHRLAGLWQDSPVPEKTVSLAGDASTRSYLRAYYADGHTAIIMLQAHAGAHERRRLSRFTSFSKSWGSRFRKFLLTIQTKRAAPRGFRRRPLETVTAGRVSEKEVSELYAQAVDLLVRMRERTN